MSEPAAPPAAPAAPEAGTPPTPEPPAAATPPAAPATDTPPAKVDDLPDWAQREIRQARDDAAKARTAKNDAETANQAQLDAIATALGLKPAETDPAEVAKTLETTTSTLTQTQSDLSDLRREHQSLLAAIDQGADHKALLDSRAFLAKIADLDPAADDFADKVAEAVTQAVTDNPKLKAGQAPTKSGAELTGGSGEGAVTKERFDAMKPSEKNELFRTNPTLYRQLSGTA